VTFIGKKLAALILILLMIVGSLVLWIGIPVGWIVLASHLTNSSAPSLGPYVLLIIGIPVTMFLFGRFLYRLNAIYGNVTGSAPNVQVRAAWLKSMRAERDNTRPRTVLDVVMIGSVSVALVAFLIWFFFFAGSSLPST
jgi:hypothetical protein